MKLTETIKMPENLDGMSAEELKAFITGIEIPEAKPEVNSSSDEITRLKNALT